MAILHNDFFRLIGFKKRPKSPWDKYYGKKNMFYTIPNMSVYEYIYNKHYKYKDNIAMEYYGTNVTYTELYHQIDICARAFRSQGVRKGDVVTILSANLVESIYVIFALNKIGAVANIVHPLSAENEIKEALIRYSSVMLVAMDICYEKIKSFINDTEVYKVIVLSAKDSMSFFYKIGYWFTQGRKVEKIDYKNDLYIKYYDFLKYGDNYTKEDNERITRDTPALILHSGGTTGTPKGIVLSNGNFYSSTIQAEIALPDLSSDDVILAIMPIFHGFGLSVSITDAFAVGAKVVVVPQFNAKTFDKLIKKYKPTVLVGVPTLFEALTNNEGMKDVDLSFLKYVISGGDTLNETRVEKINEFLCAHGASVVLTQGYGMTEAVACVSVDRKDDTHPGTIGIPMPGVYVQIVKPGTDEEVPCGEDGEICICGPNVMLGYYNNEKETNEVLHIHSDGNVWLHSGDMGSMDKDGFITYKQRLKRMIVTSGYNVYPSQIEEIIERHEAVLNCSVIGVPHPYKVEVPKAYIVLNKGYYETKALKKEIMDLCKKNLAYYSIPKDFEYRSSLPKTMIGKVDFKKLQEENNKKRKRNKAK